MARKSYRETDDARGKAGRIPIPPAAILQQAKAALWLLTHFGGVGSKLRKGFGCFADIAADDVGAVDRCRQAAAAFRRACGCDGPFQEQWADSLALEQMLPPLEITTRWKDYWFALDQLGYAVQSFAQEQKTQPGQGRVGPAAADPRPSPGSRFPDKTDVASSPPAPREAPRATASPRRSSIISARRRTARSPCAWRRSPPGTSRTWRPALPC